MISLSFFREVSGSAWKPRLPQTGSQPSDWEPTNGPETGVGVERWYVHKVDGRDAYTVDDQGAITVSVSDTPVIDPVDIHIGASVRINAPTFFADAEFAQWLNKKEPKFTWHKGGTPDEYSDVVVLVEPSFSGEGSDSDMPEHIWNQIVGICKRKFADSSDFNSAEAVTVRLTNLVQ